MRPGSCVGGGCASTLVRSCLSAVWGVVSGFVRGVASCLLDQVGGAEGASDVHGRGGDIARSVALEATIRAWKGVAVGARDTGDVRLAVRPMRTVRPVDLDGAYVNPRAVLRDRVAKGEVHRLARGMYVAVPDDVHDQVRWRPGLEAAAAAVATAVFGERGGALMGMTAARVLGAVPRARGHAMVAAPRRHRDVVLTDRGDAVVRFVRRDLGLIDTQPVRTELGVALTTTPEQTLVDLARDRTVTEVDRHEAMLALGRTVDWGRVETLARAQRGRTVTEPVLRRIRQEVGR